MILELGGGIGSHHITLPIRQVTKMPPESSHILFMGGNEPELVYKLEKNQYFRFGKLDGMNWKPEKKVINYDRK